MRGRAFVGAIALASASAAIGQTVERADDAIGLATLPVHVTGRVEHLPDGGVRRQWPGTYFEMAFTGPAAYFRVGTGEVNLRISIDGNAPASLVKPAPGLYRVSGIGNGAHRLRVDVASESQAGPSEFGGFFVDRRGSPAPFTPRARQIEFIGDSHTVGYGNTSPKRDCSEAEIWATTDTTRGLAALTAQHYDADYEVNAISGRGIVRNYNGFAADHLPEAYPFALFDKAQAAHEPNWHPQLIVIALGTNDFSTPLNPGERWKTRDALRADYEATYRRFIASLRARDPTAFILFWATDLSGGEIASEERRVVDQLRAGGDTRVGFVPVKGLAFSACNFHPSVADDRKIADALIATVDAQRGVWAR